MKLLSKNAFLTALVAAPSLGQAAFAADPPVDQRAAGPDEHRGGLGRAPHHPNYDQNSYQGVYKAVLELSKYLPDSKKAFGSKDEVDEVR